jgi:putative endonuclease
MGDRRADLGRAGERAAEEHLRGRGYVILERNFRCRGGEVDLVALCRGVVVFVEVKTRQPGAAVGPFEAVTPGKRRRLLRAARYYLARHRLEERAARFDVVGVREGSDGFACELVENAFEAGS